MTKRVLFPTLAMLLLLIALPAAQSYGRVDAGDGVAGVQPPAGPLPEDFVENFDSYADGSEMHGVNGWKGWADDPTAGALVSSAFSNSAPHSVDIVNVSDLVHEFAGYTSGQWVMTAWVYVPSGTTNGPSYFILLNSYDDAGVTNNWSTQVFFDAVTGIVASDSDGSFLTLVTDAWVEIRVEIDLDADTQDFYYDGQLLYSFSWTEGISGAGALNIAAIDFWGNLASSVYYDDISLCPATGCAPDEPPVPVVEIPTANQWALITLALLLLAAGVVMLWRRRQTDIA